MTTAHTTTIIVSDLHVGGGAADPGDDHVHDTHQLERLIDTLTASTDDPAGTVELFFNGDFFEFAQVNQQAFSHLSDERWCTEDESLAKIETILTGHPGIFTALGRFLEAGNAVTIAAGNHDVDCWWPRVQARLRAAIGERLAFEVGKEWVERHDGQLQIAHGHMNDAANRFSNWADPVVHGDWGVPCLEMCPGTLFMVKFVNRLEAKYPFADNLLPVTKLAWVLLRERLGSFSAVGWTFASFLATTSGAVLGSAQESDIGARLLSRFTSDDSARAELVTALERAGLAAQSDEVRRGRLTQEWLGDAAFALLGRIGDAEWNALFTPDPSATLGSGDGVTLSALNEARLDDGKKALRAAAQSRIDTTGASVVVMGHTHQPDTLRFRDGGTYYNPGCWTRYLDVSKAPNITLADLQDESRYPYELNFVRVRAVDGGGIASEMVCFERGGPGEPAAA